MNCGKFGIIIQTCNMKSVCILRPECCFTLDVDITPEFDTKSTTVRILMI